MSHKHKTHSFVILVITAILCLLCSSCNDNDIIPDSKAYAYLEVFKHISIETAEAYSDVEIEYIAVNLKGVLHERPSHVKKLIKDYAEERHLRIIWTNRDEYNSSRTGYMLIFEDVELTETKLKTNVTWQTGAANAFGDIYTVENEAGKWAITGWEEDWIS